MNELSKTKDYEVVIVGKKIEGSDKISYIQTAKTNEALQKAKLSGQKYIHLQISEPTEIINGKRSSRGLVKPKTTVIFESAHSRIFTMISEEIMEGRTNIFKSDPTKMELTEFLLSGKWVKRGTGFKYKLFKINGDKVEYLTSTKTVINDDGSISYKTGTATNDMIEFFLHDQDLENEEEFVRKEIERLKPFAVQGEKVVSETDLIEDTETKEERTQKSELTEEEEKAIQKAKELGLN